MNDPSPPFPAPVILLATDLSPQSDRALDRARQLALAWEAALTVLMVSEGPATPEEVPAWLDGSNPARTLEHEARAELGREFEGSGLVPMLQVTRGAVPDAILAAAAALPDALVVIGTSRTDTFPQLLLGSTALRLAAELLHPLLVVRRRAHGPYHRIAVANDFSAGARAALAMVLRLFPASQIFLFHAVEDSHAALPVVQAAWSDSETLLDGCDLAPGQRARVEVVVGSGPLTEALPRFAADSGMALVTLGVHKMGPLARLILGSRVDHLLQHLGCDSLLLRAAGPGDDA